MRTSGLSRQPGTACAAQQSPNTQAKPKKLEAAADQAIAACEGDARAALKAMIVANEFLEVEVKQLRVRVLNGYARGSPPRDRKEIESLGYAVTAARSLRALLKSETRLQEANAVADLINRRYDGMYGMFFNRSLTDKYPELNDNSLAKVER
jgi:hypothetical protein